MGIAVSLVDSMDPADLLGRVSSSDLIQSYRTWAGRWILTVGNELHGDASCNLGVFYAPTAGLTSSSAALLRALTKADVCPPEIVHGVGVDWYPGPLTRARGVFRLLPSQTLRLDSLIVLHRPLLTPMYQRDLAHALVTGLCNVGRLFESYHLPLTGGIDSRTVLAASTAANLKPAIYTFDKPNNTDGDRQIPPKLAAAVGLPHTYVRRQRFSRARQQEFDSHTLGHCVDVDRDYWAFGQWHAMKLRGVILRGGCFGFGRRIYHRIMPDTVAAGGLSVDDLLAIKRNRWLRCPQPIVQKGFSAWLEWTKAHPEDGLDVRDRLFWEQRLGSWLSSIEQGLDLVGAERIHIANSHMVYALLNRVPQELRANGTAQTEIIRRLAPELSEFRFTPPDPVVKKLARRAFLVGKKTVRTISVVWKLRVKK
jgi:hypothetical protein